MLLWSAKEVAPNFTFFAFITAPNYGLKTAANLQDEAMTLQFCHYVPIFYIDTTVHICISLTCIF